MRSATDFLPASMRTFMNFATSTDLYLGSGRISRFGTSRRRGIVAPFGARHAPAVRRLGYRGTADLVRPEPAVGPSLPRDNFNGSSGLLRALRAVLRTAL